MFGCRLGGGTLRFMCGKEGRCLPALERADRASRKLREIGLGGICRKVCLNIIKHPSNSMFGGCCTGFLRRTLKAFGAVGPCQGLVDGQSAPPLSFRATRGAGAGPGAAIAAPGQHRLGDAPRCQTPKASRMR